MRLRGAQRHVWTLLGLVCLVVGMVGIVVPLLPTTPLLILAAYLFSHGSPRMHDWLINHRIFGPPIRNWHEHRAISRRAKVWAVTAIALLFILSIALDVPQWVLVIEAMILGTVALYLLTRPTPPDEGPQH